MKQIAKEEVINYQLSNIEFHFETLHPIDREKWFTDQSSKWSLVFETLVIYVVYLAKFCQHLLTDIRHYNSRNLLTY